jgi:hypothetical protein
MASHVQSHGEACTGAPMKSESNRFGHRTLLEPPSSKDWQGNSHHHATARPIRFTNWCPARLQRGSLTLRPANHDAIDGIEEPAPQKP